MTQILYAWTLIELITRILYAWVLIELIELMTCHANFKFNDVRMREVQMHWIHVNEHRLVH